jgi:hypothetical protein
VGFVGSFPAKTGTSSKPVIAIAVELTKDQAAQLQAEARAAGVSVQGLVRERVLRPTPCQRTDQAEKVAPAQQDGGR